MCLQSFEFEHLTSGDNPRCFWIRGYVLQPDDEQYLLVNLEDLTSHKKAERVLKSEKGGSPESAPSN
jgi:hypothetical protein